MQPAHNINNHLTGQIITIVCEVWNVSRSDLVSRCRRRPLPWARNQLCQYLRIYAGHDSVSCAAILHVSPQSVQDYSHHYPTILRTYTQFATHDREIHQQVKAIIKKQHQKKITL